MTALLALLQRIEQCTLCEEELVDGVRPVLQASTNAKILIAGQAPGRKVHQSGIPFDDASGDRLREWMGISKQTFYDENKIAILPMGFCYPGKGKSGDLPPRPECAPAWREQLLAQLANIELVLVVGQYAQRYHFSKPHLSVTEQVKAWSLYWPNQVPLPHPSPRNNIWLSKNRWFEQQLVPALQNKCRQLLAG